MNPAISEHEAASLAAEMFDHFCAATTMRQILGLYRNMCDILGLRPGPLNEFYPKFKAKIRNWKAQALWKKFDARASHRVYNKGTAANGTRVLVIGAGPCGLRTAIEAQLLGAKVVVVEKRDRITRNNVLHLWPFLITDLKALGAKKFYGKFCAGSIDHISIRQLQCILLKVALLLGVEVHEGVSFSRELEPKDGCGWRAAVSPEDHAVSHYEFDVLIGADGKRNTLEGFKRKEFRGKLAIAITANFINKKTEAEAKVEEISGVAFIFNQSFFKELYQTTGIDLENIVYYKDETHYFVMTAKKHSLLDKGVIIQDYADPAELLSSANVDTSKLLEYAREAADFSTKYQMPNLEFAVNHYGKPDVAMFDFTSMFAADNSCKMTVRKNYRLLSCLVGDSLLEPFWPTGSGCARGFLSSMDAAYAIKLFSNQKNSLLAVLAQRESIYRLLAQTTPENLHRDIGSYTLDPSTRYPNLNKSSVNMIQVKHLLDTDDPALLEQTFLDTNSLTAGPEVTIIKRKRRTNDTVPLGTVLLRWVKSQLKGNDFVQELSEASQCFTNGRVLCTLINRYRPDLVNLEELEGCSADECNEVAFSIFENHLGIPRVMSGQDSLSLTSVDSKQWLNYLEQICEVFRGEIPHVKHPKLDYAEFKQKQQIDNMEEFAKLRRFAANRMAAMNAAPPPIAAAAGPGGVRKSSIYHHNEEERIKRSRKVLGAESSPIASPQTDTTKRAKKRRSYEKFGNIEERTRRLQEIEANRLDRQTKRRLVRAQQTQNFYTSLHMLQANNLLRESGDSSSAFEDYSLFVYRQSAPEFTDRVAELERKLRYPDRDRGLAAAYPRSLVGAGPDGEQFSDRIKSMEQRIGGKQAPVAEKKPKDLLRAIGKIDSNDWNVKEIEKKIELSKKATDIGKSRERVPKWNREQFLARQNKLTQQPDDEKYREIDSSIKAVDKQLKEGHNLDLGERGKNKVASIAGQLQSTRPQQQQQHHQKSTSKAALVLTSSGVAEKCHFCKQRVYLMEKISAENLTLHRSCLKCHHCHTNLRLGGYAFDRDDPEGKFYCTQHFKLPSKTVKPIPKRSHGRPSAQHQMQQQVDKQAPPVAIGATGSAQPSTPDSKSSGINFDLLDRGETPERIEFENADESISDGEAAMEVIDENEWTDRNFGTESDESDEDMSSSDESDSESDSDYEEAAGSPLGAQTLQLASEWISDKRFSNMVDSDDDFYGYSSEDDEADSQTEGEELARAREMRMQEVKLMPPPTLPTDTETEVAPKLQSPVVDPTACLNQLSSLNIPCTTVPNPQPAIETAEEKALREKMLQKLSVREQWLHSSTPSPPPAPVGATVPPAAPEAPKPKTSFFGGLMNSLSTLIKSDKSSSPKLPSPPPQISADSPPSNSNASPQVPPSPSPSLRNLAISSEKPPPSPTPSLRRQKRPDVPPSPTLSLRKQKLPEVPPSPTPSLKKHKKHKHASPSPTPSAGSLGSSHPDDVAFEEMFGDDLKEHSSGRSTPLSKRRSRPKSSDVREDADQFLEKIKQDQAALDKRMKKVEAKKFQSNMQSIKSAVEGPRIVGVKSEKDVSKFFGAAKKDQLEPKPKQLPNKDVSALQGVNLSKYFPTASSTPTTSARASIGTPSSVSSAEGSPVPSRKKPSEVDLMKYFGPSTAKSSPSSPASAASPAISRKNSVESPGAIPKITPMNVQPTKPLVTPAVIAPKPPVVPLPPKKNVLALQTVKKSQTESALQPSAVPVKNALAFQSIAGKKPASPKPIPKVKAKSPPKKLSPSLRKSPDTDDKLFEDLLKDVDDTQKLSHEPMSDNQQPPNTQDKLLDELLKDLDKSPKTDRKLNSVPSSPQVKKKSNSPPKRRSPDLDDQLFEDLLGDVDDILVENFEEIVGLPKKKSPKPSKKQSPRVSPKQSPQPAKKANSPAAPKMTIKRPPFKIVVPVKMQETLEEIYLASLSKLDTRSASTTSLNSLKSAESDLGKIDEAFEALLQEPKAAPSAPVEPIKIQPFQAPQTTKKQAGGKKEEKVYNIKMSSPERTLVSQISSVETKPVTPKPTKKIIVKKKEVVKSTQLQQSNTIANEKLEDPIKSIQSSTPTAKSSALTSKVSPLKNSQIGSIVSLDKLSGASTEQPILNGTHTPRTPSAARKVLVQESSIPVAATPVMKKKVVSAKTASPVPQQKSGISGSETASPITTKKVNSTVAQMTQEASTPSIAKKVTDPSSMTTVRTLPQSSEKSVLEKATPVMPRKMLNTSSTTEHALSTVITQNAKNSMSVVATPVEPKLIKPLADDIFEPRTPVVTRKVINSTTTGAITKPIPGTIPTTTESMRLLSTGLEQKEISTPRKRNDEPKQTNKESATSITSGGAFSGDIEMLQRERTLSTDDICFQELRKKHEAIFREQQKDQAATSKVVSKRDEFYKEILESNDQTCPVVEEQSIEVPRTLSEFRSSILSKHCHPDNQTAEGRDSMFCNTINEIAMEIMPGANLDDMLDDIPVKVERKKSSFQKMLHKLQRSNTIAATEGSSLKSLLTPSTTQDFKMEVVREVPAKKEVKAPSPQPVVEDKSRMAINLERSAQIKEKYAKQKAPSPPKSTVKVPTETCAPPALERKTSFKIQAPIQKKETAADLQPIETVSTTPKPAQRRSPRKQLSASQKQTTVAPQQTSKQSARTSPSNVQSELLNNKHLSLPAANSIDLQRSILSREPEESKQIVDEFDDLFNSIDSSEVVNIEDLLSSDDEAVRSSSVEAKPRAKPTVKLLTKPMPIDTKNTGALQKHAGSVPSSQESKAVPRPLEQNWKSISSVKPVGSIPVKQAVETKPTTMPTVNLPTKPMPMNTTTSQKKAVDLQKHDGSVPSMQESRAVTRPLEQNLKSSSTANTVGSIPAKQAPIKKEETINVAKMNNVEVQKISCKAPAPEMPKATVAVSEPLSEKEFKDAASQLTEKFTSAKLKPSDEKTSLKQQAMFTTLTETDISGTNLLESLTKVESVEKSKVDSSDLINGSNTSLSVLPDVVSMTQKPTIEEQAPLKVLDYADKIKQVTQHVPQEIQVYTLHTEDGKQTEPQPSTSGVTGDYARLLKDITSGLVGSDLAMPVVYEPPPVVDTKPKSDFVAYKQMLQEMSKESGELGIASEQPQRPLRRPKQLDRSVSPAARPFDNSICIDPWRAKKSSSIENIAIEQVFVKENDKVIDTFYVVPEQPRQLKRRSKSFDRLDVPSLSRPSARQQKKSLEEIRDYGYDIEPPSAVKHLVNPRLRHLDLDGSDDDLPRFREPRRWDRVRKCNSTTDTSKLDVEATRVEIDRESPIPRSTDFSKWEAILDRGVPYYQEPKGHKKEDIKALERRLDELKMECKPRRKITGKAVIPKDYDPEEYVPRINRRVLDSFDIPDPNLPKSYDPEEYIPRAQRNYDDDVPTSVASRPQRIAAYETEVPVTRVAGKYYQETMHLDDFPSHTLPRSKTSSHIPYSTVSTRSHDLPSRNIAKTQYSRRAMVDNKSIVSRSQRLHEKTNKYIRSQITKNDPNPYIREMLENDSDDEHYPVTTSASHRTPITTSASSYHPVSTYGSSGSAALSRITTKAITQPSRMSHYTRKDVPSSSAAAGSRSYRRGGGGESSNRRDNCAIS